MPLAVASSLAPKGWSAQPIKVAGAPAISNASLLSNGLTGGPPKGGVVIGCALTTACVLHGPLQGAYTSPSPLRADSIARWGWNAFCSCVLWSWGEDGTVRGVV